MKAFFSVDTEGKVTSIIVSETIVTEDEGFQLNITEEQAEQIEKFELHFENNVPKLRLKDGEVLEEREETEEEREIRELEERLAQLKGDN